MSHLHHKNYPSFYIEDSEKTKNQHHYPHDKLVAFRMNASVLGRQAILISTRYSSNVRKAIA